MAKLMMMKVAYRNLVSLLLLVIIASSCSVSKQINKQASKILFADSTISTGFMGISIYDVATDRYLYNHNADKYFVPASNTKLFSLYAGMKYLGDSLVGLRYSKTGSNFLLFPTGDPTFLHPDFKSQKVYDFFSKINGDKKIFVLQNWKENNLGYGWSWDDYSDYYMAERSSFPVYGNVIDFIFTNDSLVSKPNGKFDIIPSSSFSFEEKRKFNGRRKNSLPETFSIKRLFDLNAFEYTPSSTAFSTTTIPLKQNNELLNELLKDTLHLKDDFSFYQSISPLDKSELYSIHSQPSDSLFTSMMHRSDNFFAEQTLLMASNERLGYMKDEDIIDTLLNTDLKDIPQRPQWVDGSGLSRYNLFTPQDFIFILNKLKNEFGLERVQKILPTGGTGTLKRYFNSDSGFIFAKTGTLSNHVALSGYLITKKNKLLLFSILNNNYEGSSTPIRRAVEKFLQQLREKY